MIFFNVFAIAGNTSSAEVGCIERTGNLPPPPKKWKVVEKKEEMETFFKKKEYVAALFRSIVKSRMIKSSAGTT